jgi:hypothetical protein
VTRHESESPTELTTTLAHALATVTGADVTDVETMLYDRVDPTAVNRLFESESPADAGTHASLTMTIWGHHVTVSDTGAITIAPPQAPTPRW